MTPTGNEDIKLHKTNVEQAVELALIHRDIDDLRSGQQELKASQDNIEREIRQLATTDDIKQLREQLELLMPWAQTLGNLERMSKWLAALAAGVAVIVAALNWFKGGGS